MVCPQRRAPRRAAAHGGGGVTRGEWEPVTGVVVVGQRRHLQPLLLQVLVKPAEIVDFVLMATGIEERSDADKLAIELRLLPAGHLPTRMIVKLSAVPL